VYGLGWLVALGLIGVVIGLTGGWFLAGRSGRYSLRVEALEAELAAARRELGDYRQQVVEEFSETARKFQTLNDAYTDLHRQLAQSSSVLCGDVGAPLLKAPDGHQDLLDTEQDEPSATDEESADAEAESEAEELEVADAAASSATAKEPEPEPAAADGESREAHTDQRSR
jgi:uncharacterized membrane-anchored protein YhcB (DUF1043 family)